MIDIFDEDTTPRMPLKDAIRLLRLAVPKRSSLPVLRSVRIHSDGATVSMDGTDLENWIHLDSVDTSCPVGTWLADFAKMSAGLPLEQILEPENGDFPTYTKANGTTFPGAWLQVLPRVSFAMSDDCTRLSLNGVTVESGTVGAIDGHRGAFVKVDTSAPFPFILGAASVHVLERIKGTPEVCAVDDRSIHIRFPWGFYGGKVLEGPFPNWRQTLRRHHTYKVQVPRKVLTDWCSRIPASSGGKTSNALHLQIFQKHILGIAAMVGGERLNLGQVSSIGGPADSNPVTVGVNPQYLQDILSKLPGSHVVLGVCEPSQAMFLNPDSDDIYIQMPLRIS